MARVSLAVAAALGIGIGVGLSLGWVGQRGGLTAVAAPQQTSPRGNSAPNAAQTKPAGEDGIYGELTRQYERFEPIDRTFALVARAVSPAVVHIVAKKPGRRTEEGHLLQFEETGSGVIVRPERSRAVYVLTNNHVVEGAAPRDVAITLHDGRVERPEHVWSDTKADIAVIKLPRDDLPSARLGDSDLAAVGSWVLALGSPFGLTHSVSQGIISARNRHEEELEDDGVENQEFLQTDAAINPGNSGGPLVNMRGEVIGINTAIASNGGGSEGVGFSIPINLARWILDQLVSTGKVSRGAMGVELEGLGSAEALVLGLERPRGARIKTVRPSSPAAAAGCRPGDVILRYNDVEVRDFNHLINLVSMSPIGRAIEVVLWRDRKAVSARVVIADRDAVLVQPAASASGPAPRPRAGAPLRRPARPPGAEENRP
jgi:serine protease Do